MKLTLLLFIKEEGKAGNLPTIRYETKTLETAFTAKIRDKKTELHLLLNV